MRKKAVSNLPISPVELSKCSLDAKAFLMLTDHSTSENSTSNPVICLRNKETFMVFCKIRKKNLFFRAYFPVRK